MKNLYIIATLITLFINTKAVANPFHNFKEGKTELISGRTRKNLTNFLNEVNEGELLNGFQNVFGSITKRKQACSHRVLKILKNELNTISGVDFNDQAKVILAFGRDNNVYDDIVYKNLLLNFKIWTSIEERTDFRNTGRVHYNYVVDDETKDLGHSWRKDLKSGRCLVDSSLKLFYKLSSDVKPKKKNKKIRKEIANLYSSGVLNSYEYELLENLRINKILKVNQTLGQYFKLLKSMSKTYPQTEQTPSDFVSKRSSKKKLSLREKLITTYDIYQIGLLSDLMKRLKIRLEAQSINILVYNDDGQIQEDIPLAPLEQYRFSIKMIRKEMIEIRMLPRFQGFDPKFGDLIAAAYETGILASEELDFISDLELLWNPKLTRKEKIMKFTKEYGGVVQILIPPPYNYAVPIFLALLEYFTYEVKADGAADITNIF